MKVKGFAFTWLCNIFLLSPTTSFAEKNENSSLLIETSLNHTSKHVLDGRPIVIHTQLNHYDQPTLKEYQECHENLEKCKRVCEENENTIECVKECPVCPLLVKEKIVGQGVNDTDFRISKNAAAAPLNTTNIIRLTNQIRNIIETHQGSVTYRNENTVHLNQNISKVGGKFGLGYNGSDPCCTIVRSSKHCEEHPFSTASRCHHKRQRVCGKQCKSRIMIAKRVTVCEKPMAFFFSDDYSEENCHETVKYVPYTLHKKRNFKSRNKCSFIPAWPYILCDQNKKNYEYSICSHCLGITYFYILQNGIPPQCITCFARYFPSHIEMYPETVHDSKGHNNDFGFDNDFGTNSYDWEMDKVKCIMPDGTVSESCPGYGRRNTDSLDFLENLPDSQHDFDEYYADNGEENSRKRRHTFNRSKYSHRYGLKRFSRLK